MRILTHGIDVDGIASGILLKRHLASIGTETTVSYTDYPSLPEDMRSALREPPVIVADISPSRRSEVLEVFKRAQEIAGTDGPVIERWYDHHDWGSAGDLRPYIGTFVHSTTLSTAWIIASTHSLDDQNSVYLSYLAQLSDRHIDTHPFSPDADTAQKAILAATAGCGPSLDTLVDDLSHGVTLPDSVVHGAKRYVQAVREDSERLLQEVTVYTLERGVTVGIATAPQILYMKEGNELLLKNRDDLDLVVTVFPNNALMMRARDRSREYLDVERFCRDRGGGGRDGQGGYVVDHDAFEPLDLVESLNGHLIDSA